MRSFGKGLLLLLGAVVIIAILYAILTRRNTGKMVSEFGDYQGYSDPAYDGSQRTSDYLTLSDGTRLAYDLILPTRGGEPPSEPLPALFKYTPYGRTWTIFDRDGTFLPGAFVDAPMRAMARVRYWVMGDKGRIMDPLWRDKWLGPVVRHGYAVVSVDRPGTGASFASPTPGSMEIAAQFTGEIIDWIAAQPWSDGNVAMYGDSQNAMVQFAAASTGNPHLKAVLPSASDLEIYQAVNYPGGVYNEAFASLYSLAPLLDKVATPVDSDPDGRVLQQARESRVGAGVLNAADVMRQSPYLDSLTPDGINPWDLYDLYPFLDRINRGQTAIYLTVGWYDVFTADMFLWYQNLKVPRHLTVRPTDHSQVSANLPDLNYGMEALRWLDYWLKGIDNGIMDEPPLHYYVMDGRTGSWQTADEWPLPAEQLNTWYFGPGPSASVASGNDGTLGPLAATEASAADPYTVDYSTTTGTKTRWGAIEEAHAYPDLEPNDAKALTYTTSPLEGDVEVTGHPQIDLWLATGASDLDVYVYLEEVEPSGKSSYVTEGNLRASHRKLSPAPFDNLDLPYHSHLLADVEPVQSGEPIEMTLSLLPTSYVFRAGNRIRVTVAFADAGNFDTPILSPAPSVRILRDVEHPSFVVLPIIEGRQDVQ